MTQKNQSLLESSPASLIRKGKLRVRCKNSQANRIFELSPKELGAEGEAIARAYLERSQFKILETNWRSIAGEADIIVCDQSGTVVFVEVKTRLQHPGTEVPFPELAVDSAKQQRYAQMANLYLAKHPRIEQLRFDVISIVITGEGQARLRHIVDAFEAE